MAADLYLVEGDASTTVDFTLVDANGAIDLTDASQIRFVVHARPDQGAFLADDTVLTVTAVAPGSGRCRVTFDDDVTAYSGYREGGVVVTWSQFSAQQAWPSDRPISLCVLPHTRPR